MYLYDVAADQWTEGSRTQIDGKYYDNEALAYDSAAHRIYSTVVAAQQGGDPDARKKLTIYDVMGGEWTGFTAAAPNAAEAGSEAEYLGGKIYVWSGGGGGAAVNGSDSYLDVFDIASGSWSRTPSLLDSGVMPGFRTGSFDIWGVSLTADPARDLLYVTGGERNRVLYVFTPATQAWTAGPAALYDGGWGSSLEYVAARGGIVLIDGRNATEAAQGTAMLTLTAGDFDHDLEVGLADFDAFSACLNGEDGGPVVPGCLPGDLDCDGDVDCVDWQAFQDHWTASGEPPALPVCADVGVGEGGVPGAEILLGTNPIVAGRESRVSFALPGDGRALLQVYSVGGAVVITLFDGLARAGRISVRWDGLDGQGALLPRGIYFLRLTTPAGRSAVVSQPD